MTKIAIYGDSFAADYEGWPKYLGELMKCEVKTFGHPSTSIGYSYLKFLETHEDYDLVYFIWTDIQRSWLVSTSNGILSDTKDDSTLKHYICFTPSWVREDPTPTLHIDENYTGMPNRKNISNIGKKFIFKWVTMENYWSKIFENKNLLSIIAMRDSVKHRRPDCFNIQAFDYFKTNKNSLTLDMTPGLWRIVLQDMMQYQRTGDYKWLSENPKSERRFNHLSKIQNQEFAQYLFELYKNKDFDIHKTFKNPKKYYTMSKSIEESGFIL